MGGGGDLGGIWPFGVVLLVYAWTLKLVGCLILGDRTLRSVYLLLKQLHMCMDQEMGHGASKRLRVAAGVDQTKVQTRQKGMLGNSKVAGNSSSAEDEDSSSFVRLSLRLGDLPPSSLNYDTKASPCSPLSKHHENRRRPPMRVTTNQGNA